MEVRTSDTHPIEVAWFPIDIFAPGRVGITIAPGKQSLSMMGGFRWQRDLGADLDRLAKIERVDTLVSLVEDHELETLNIRTLPNKARRRGIELVRFPIVDVSVPKSITGVERLLVKISRRLRDGSRAVAHCVGGRGRSGTIAGCLLALFGRTDVFELLHDARGPSCPETEQQCEFIRAFARRTNRQHGEPR